MTPAVAPLWRLTLLAAVILVLRTPDSFLFPTLRAEDSTQVLNFYFNNPGTVFQLYTAYVSVLPDILGYLSVALLPLPWLPYACAWISLALAAAAIGLTATRVAEWGGLSRGGGLALAALLPFAATFPLMMAGTLFYALWNMLLLAAVLAETPLPAGRLRVALRLTAEALLLTANPVAAVLVPWRLWQGWRAHGRGLPVWPDVLRVATILLYCLLLTEPVSAAAILAHADLGANAVRVLHLLLVGGVFEGVFGVTAQHSLSKLAGPWAPAACGGAVALAIGAILLRRGAGCRHLLLWALWLSASILAVVAVQRPDKIDIVLTAARRYVYLPNMLWKAAALTACLSLSTAAIRRGTVAAVTLALAIGIALDYRPPRDRQIAEGRAVHAFLVDTAQALERGESGPFVFERGQWSLRLTRPGG